MAINPSEITTIRVGELPLGEIGIGSKIAIESGTDLYQVTFQDLVDYFNINLSSRQFQIIDLWVTQEYIDTNFDNTGLGINICIGLAICNGQNGTPPMDGLVSVGYGNNYNVIGAFGGSKNAVVVEHTHQLTIAGNAGGSGNVTFNDGAGTGKIYTTQTTGVSGLNKNMQPYIVLLKCMKL